MSFSKEQILRMYPNTQYYVKDSNGGLLAGTMNLEDAKKYADKFKKQDRDEVQFISAEYINDPEAVKEVEKIIHQNKQSARILIATAVLDNGINIEDIELRNLVILADAKTELIQMLGRKRKDGNKVKVYICSRSEAHFIRRQNNIKKQLELALEIKGRIGVTAGKSGGTGAAIYYLPKYQG